jgi:DNA-binding MarR family transcriptional regulator
LQSEHSQNEASLSTAELAAWRRFLECAFAMIDILDAELRDERDLTLRWYDVLVQLEEAGGACRMSELAGRILASKSGLTRVIDRMEAEGLVRRARPEDDRRVILVCITPEGLEALAAARMVHRRGIHDHFIQHLDARDVAALERTFKKVSEHVRPLRPGRVSG